MNTFPQTDNHSWSCRTSILEGATFHEMRYCKFLWSNPCKTIETFFHWDSCLWDFWFSTHFSHSAAWKEFGDGFGVTFPRLLISWRKLQLSPFTHCPLVSHCQQSPRILCTRCFVPWCLTTAFYCKNVGDGFDCGFFLHACPVVCMSWSSQSLSKENLWEFLQKALSLLHLFASRVWPSSPLGPTPDISNSTEWTYCTEHMHSRSWINYQLFFLRLFNDAAGYTHSSRERRMHSCGRIPNLAAVVQSLHGTW